STNHTISQPKSGVNTNYMQNNKKEKAKSQGAGSNPLRSATTLLPTLLYHSPKVVSIPIKYKKEPICGSPLIGYNCRSLPLLVLTTE
ncbi:MAG: hypothetical protein RR271_06290, partial [Oscillospiraceae bacterium]